VKTTGPAAAIRNGVAVVLTLFNLCPYALNPLLEHRDREALAVACGNSAFLMA
jgi:hypothetical protein